jgi:CHAT domain-containing protein
VRFDDYRLIMTRAAGWRERLEDDPELARIAQRMYRNFFGEKSFELEGVDRLIVEFAVHDEWVHADAMLDPNGHYLSERYAVSYSPSAAVYVALASARRLHRKDEALRVLAIGDPAFSVASLDDSIGVALATRVDDVTLRAAVNGERRALDNLPQLPYSGNEIERLQALFSDCRALRGRDASEESVNRIVKKGQLDDFDIVHFATHALVDQSPERCAIALSRNGVDGSISNDGLIDTPEIRMGWELDAELVTLSACQTAGMQYSRGEPIGFAPALFQAGARCVLLSLWKVDDEATWRLMSRFYENVSAFSKQRKPVSYSEALADAKRWVRNYRDEKGRHPFAHPIYWSGFVLIGDAK